MEKHEPEEMTLDTDGRLDITVETASQLILSQFPQWSNLSITPVKQSGWDNKTFHLGTDMLIRMPSAERYATAVELEHTWLPFLASNLSVSIPAPLAIGKPSESYPWPWSVYGWIEGETADTLKESDLPQFAADLADFLRELHVIDTANAPVAGPPFYRGCSPKAYDDDTRLYLRNLSNIIDSSAASSVWEAAISSEWSKNPVWIHGDLGPQNILVSDQKLAAVIDFGGTCVGDPSCDLVIAWTFLK